jgi:protocatechuate 3,4-dioxygenase beta subunit
VIRDQAGRPVPDAAVTVTEPNGRQVARASAAADGRYAIERLAPGPYIVIVSAQDRQPFAKSILFGAVDLAQDVVLKGGAAGPSGEVNGVIQSPQGVPLAGMTVTATDGTGDVVANTVTDGSGGYRFTGLADGHYAVVAAGHQPVTVTVEVEADAPTTVRVALGGEVP